MDMYQIKNDIRDEIKLHKENFKRLNRKMKRFLLEQGFYSYRISRVK